MRRPVAVFLTLAGVLGLIGWVWFYVYVFGMACAFSNGPSTGCKVKFPWNLNGVDFTFLVLLPGGFVLILFVSAWLTARGARKDHKSDS